MDTLSAPTRNPDLLRRTGVTLAALAIYRIGCWIPLPGVEVSRLVGQTAPGVLGSAIERLSIMALGVLPILSALIVAEVALIAWPRLRIWAGADPGADRLDGWIVWGALLLAAVQANGLAVALEDVGGLVPQPGLTFRAGVVASLVTATAVLIWLASLVGRQGVGSGFWVLLGAAYLVSAVHPALVEVMRGAPNGLVALALALAFLILCVTVLAALTKAVPPLAETGEPLWAPILGFVVAGWVLAGLDGLFGPFDLAFSALLLVTIPLVALALAVVLRRRSVAHAGRADFSVASAVPLVVALVGLVMIGHLLGTLVQPLFPSAGSMLLIAAAGLAVAEGLARSGAAADATTQPADPAP